MSFLSGIACFLLISASLAVPQRGHHDPTPDDRNAPPDRQLASAQVDPARLRRDAAELTQLANTVPPDVERALNGVLAKDLKDRLKRIEKLSKNLRGQLALQ